MISLLPWGDSYPLQTAAHSCQPPKKFLVGELYVMLHLLSALILCLKVPRKEKKNKEGESDRALGDSQSTTKKNWVDSRLQWINCCEKCEQGKCNPVRKLGGNMERQRLGRKTTQYCPSCGVVLCKFCWNKFHSNDIELPACSPFLHMVPISTRCTTEPEQTNEMRFILRRQVSPREEEIDCEGENTEDKDEVVEVCEALANLHQTARTGKTCSPRKKGTKEKKGRN